MNKYDRRAFVNLTFGLPLMTSYYCEIYSAERELVYSNSVLSTLLLKDSGLWTQRSYSLDDLVPYSLPLYGSLELMLTHNSQRIIIPIEEHALIIDSNRWKFPTSSPRTMKVQSIEKGEIVGVDGRDRGVLPPICMFDSKDIGKHLVGKRFKYQPFCSRGLGTPLVRQVAPFES